MRSVREFPCLHPAKEIQIFFDRPGPVGTLFAGLGESSSIFAHLIGCQAIDVGFTFFDQDDGKFIELLEIVRGVELLAVPVESQPAHVVFNGRDEFRIFRGGVRVVETQVADSPRVFPGDSEIEADGFGMADVEIPVRFRWKAGDDAAVVLPGGLICCHDFTNEIGRTCRCWFSHWLVARCTDSWG